MSNPTMQVAVGCSCKLQATSILSHLPSASCPNAGPEAAAAKEALNPSSIPTAPAPSPNPPMAAAAGPGHALPNPPRPLGQQATSPSRPAPAKGLSPRQVSNRPQAADPAARPMPPQGKVALPQAAPSLPPIPAWARAGSAKASPAPAAAPLQQFSSGASQEPDFKPDFPAPQPMHGITGQDSAAGQVPRLPLRTDARQASTQTQAPGRADATGYSMHQQPQQPQLPPQQALQPQVPPQQGPQLQLASARARSEAQKAAQHQAALDEAQQKRNSAAGQPLRPPSPPGRPGPGSPWAARQQQNMHRFMSTAK